MSRQDIVLCYFVVAYFIVHYCDEWCSPPKSMVLRRECPAEVPCQFVVVQLSLFNLPE